MKAGKAKPLTGEVAEVQSAISSFFEAMDAQDMQRMSELIAHDADMVHFGTDLTERWAGWQDLKVATEQMFESLEAYTISISNQVVQVASSGEVAWFSQIVDTRVTTQTEEVATDGARFTGVLEKRKGRWVFVQSHLSVPVSGQHVAY